MLLPPTDGKPGKQRHHGKNRTLPNHRKPAREACTEEEALSAASFRRRDERTDDEWAVRT